MKTADPQETHHGLDPLLLPLLTCCPGADPGLPRGTPEEQSPGEPEHDLEPKHSLEGTAGVGPREGAPETPEPRDLVSTAGPIDPSCVARRLQSFPPI